MPEARVDSCRPDSVRKCLNGTGVKRLQASPLFYHSQTIYVMVHMQTARYFQSVKNAEFAYVDDNDMNVKKSEREFVQVCIV